MDIKKKLQQAPSYPGVYIMKDHKDRVIYVGKAKNLKNRLRSYFQISASSISLDSRKLKMVKETRDFDYVVTKNELEALVLEANFIKKTKPKYNIILRDDKNYPYLKLTVNEEWPRLEVTRKIANDGSLYFGPYVPTNTMWEILKFVRRNFPLRTCKNNLEKTFRPCVQYQMKRCLAPCSEDLRDKTHREKYLDVVNTVKYFLQGKKKELLLNLNKKMHVLSENLQFEEAVRIRDDIKTIEKAWETQRVILPGLGDIDVIGMHRENNAASVFMLFIRTGILIGQKGFFFEKLEGIKNAELIKSFIEQFYSKEIVLPQRIILPFEVKLKTQSNWLSKKRQSKILISIPRDRKESDILRMALENAEHFFHAHKGIKTTSDVRELLLSLKELLNLKSIPEKICAVDVSNISGSEAVGSLVAWEDGKFIKNDYRLFKIKTVKGIDDFAMIEEVVSRYCKGLSEKNEQPPDLLIIDGGRGQLESALKAIKPFALPVEIVAIAKAKEEQPDRIFLHRRIDAIPLESFKATTHLLQSIRDEAHRFAITYHKKLRAKRVLESPLEKVKGIGKTRRLLLLRHFGSIDNIRKASVEEIALLKGMNKKIAEVLKTFLGETK